MRSYTPADLLDLGACESHVDLIRRLLAERGWSSVRPTTRNLRWLEERGVDGAWAVQHGLVPREAACGDPAWAYLHARYVDGGPRPDTRAAACADPEWAYWYAIRVDEGPRDDTRDAACADPGWAYDYARYVDGSPRDDTRSAACGSPVWAYSYALDVDGGPHPATWAAVRGLDWEYWYRRRVGEP